LIRSKWCGSTKLTNSLAFWKVAKSSIMTLSTMPENSGLIIRTAGAGKALEELQWEVDY
jgi:hypothetical protein